MEKLANLVNLENFDDRIFLNDERFSTFLDQHDFCYLRTYDILQNVATIEIPVRTIGSEDIPCPCIARFEFKPTFTKMYTVYGVRHLEEVAASYVAATVFAGQFTRIEHHPGTRYLELKQTN